MANGQSIFPTRPADLPIESCEADLCIAPWLFFLITFLLATLFVTAAACLKTKTSLMLSLSLLNRPLHQTLTWVWDFVDSFIFIVLVKYKNKEASSLQFLSETIYLFIFLWRSLLWIRGNFNTSTNRCGPSSRSIALSLGCDRLLCWLPGPRSTSTRPINQTGSYDWWQCVRNEFYCPGLNCAEGGEWKTERKKWKRRGWDNERWFMNERSRHKSTQKHWTLSVESDTGIHTPQSNEERNLFFIFFNLALMDQSNCTVDGRGVWLKVKNSILWFYWKLTERSNFYKT